MKWNQIGLRFIIIFHSFMQNHQMFDGVIKSMFFYVCVDTCIEPTQTLNLQVYLKTKQSL